jgi:hypothetical protein
VANQDDFDRILDADTPEARLYGRAMGSATARWPVRDVAGVVYIDCSLWQIAEPTDIVQADFRTMLILLQDNVAELIDPVLRHMLVRWREANPNGIGASKLTKLVNQLCEKEFAVYFANNDSVPGNIRGEILNMRAAMMDKRLITTTRYDGTPITRPA